MSMEKFKYEGRESGKTGASELEEFVGKEESCHLLKDFLFSKCSYCSCGLKKKDKHRCTNCGWMYCGKCIGDSSCMACEDKMKWDNGARVISYASSVLVVGSGIGGLAAALGLKRRGVETVVVLERASTLRTLGGSLNIQTNAMKALLDLSPEVMAKTFDHAGGLDSPGGFMTKKGRMLFETDLSGANQHRWGYPEGGSIMRPLLQQILYEECLEHGIEVKFGTHVVDVDESDDLKPVTLTLEDGAMLQADFVVAADGIWSKLRSKIYPNAGKPIYHGHQIIGGVSSNDSFNQSETPGCWGEGWGSGNRFGFFRAGEGGVSWYYFRKAKVSKDQDATGEELKNIVLSELKKNGYASDFIKIVEASDGGNLITPHYLPSLEHHVSREGQGRVVLLGDAANGAPPCLGQMGCMALESASILSQVLAVSETLKEGLEKYERRRITRCNNVAKQSQVSGKIFAASNPVSVYVRNKLFKYLGDKANSSKIDPVDRPDPFAYLFSYRLMALR